MPLQAERLNINNVTNMEQLLRDVFTSFDKEKNTRGVYQDSRSLTLPSPEPRRVTSTLNLTCKNI